jgi:hypothetical protein
MTITEAVYRVNQIESQLAALNAGVSAPNVSTGAAAPATATPPSFANALAQAQGASPAGAGTGGITAPDGPGLSATASQQLTSGQREFASRLAAETGLNPQVIAAWLLAEESGSAATGRQSANNNDWLNIGYTDSATYGASDSVWSSPDSAADATAGWLKGQNTIPGYGTASSGIQAILQTAGQSPQAQIAAIQQSGWASSGYPDLPSLYQQVSG